MIKAELKRMLAEHKALIDKRMEIIDEELKSKQDYDDNNFKDIELKLHGLAINLLEKMGFPFGIYRIKVHDYSIQLDKSANTNGYLIFKGYRKKHWSRVNFFDVGASSTSTKTVLSLLGSSFVKLVMECQQCISDLMARRIKMRDNIKINNIFNVDVIDNLEVKQRKCKGIEFNLFNLNESAKDFTFEGLYNDENRFAFLNNDIYNLIMNAIKERKDDIKKFIKLMEKRVKEMNSHINEPYLGMLGLE